MFHSFSEILEIMCTILDVMGWFWSPTKVIKFTLYFSLTSVTIWCAFRCQYHWILVTMYVSETEAEQSAVWPQPWGKFSSNHRPVHFYLAARLLFLTQFNEILQFLACFWSLSFYCLSGRDFVLDKYYYIHPLLSLNWQLLSWSIWWGYGLWLPNQYYLTIECRPLPPQIWYHPA